jgi:TPR repeat protein
MHVWSPAVIRNSLILALAAAVLSAAPAGAAPADDHARGLAAYNRGDVVAAMSALRAPAKAGHAPSQVFLAFILDRADFVDEALALYRDAAAQDDPAGHAGLANAYLTGRGIAKDEKAALQHFSKAAERGHALSIEVVADAHLKGQFGLAGAPDAQVLAAVRRAAEQGHLPSIDALAQAHASGRWGLADDPAQAAAWRQRGAELRARRALPASAPAPSSTAKVRS